jgi:hypothetical protein
MNSYSKIYQLGHRETLGMFVDPVIVEEKIDGSQFSFGKDFDHNITCRSRNNVQFESQGGGRGDKMFDIAIASVLDRAADLMPGWTYRGEYLSKPKHNALCYDRVPQGNIIIFDIDMGNNQYLSYDAKVEEAARIGLETAPLIFQGQWTDADDMLSLLDRVSILGGSKIEGMVFKQYEMLDCMANVVMAKYVSDAFKEVHQGDWKRRNPGQADILESIATRFRTPARWQKALQHLKEESKIQDEPRDIGLLVKEVQRDIIEECGDDIKDILFSWAMKKLNKRFVAGLPEWYKGLLAQRIDNALQPVQQDGTSTGEPDTSDNEG